MSLSSWSENHDEDCNTRGAMAALTNVCTHEDHPELVAASSAEPS